jgi:hypothetical protein
MARRKRDDIVEVQEDEHGTLEMPGMSSVITLREETWPEIIFPAIRVAIFYVLGMAAALLIVYTIFASSLLFRTTVDGHALFVARTTYQGGVPRVGSNAYVSTQPDSGTFINNVEVGFRGAPNASVYKIQSGPYDKVRFINSSIYVGSALVGRSTQPASIPAGSSTIKLNNQYLGQCISGYCLTPGQKQWAVINAANVYGEVRAGR